MIVQDRRARLHRIYRVDHMRQHFIIHLDQLQRAPGDSFAGRGDRGDRVTVKQRLLARHGHACHVTGGTACRLIREVVTGNNGLHTGKCFGGRCIDRLDDRMRMRAAQNAAEEHAGQEEIGTEFRATGNLVQAVMFNRVGPDYVQFTLSIEF